MMRMTDPWIDRLSEYVDGELDAATRNALDTHLPTCAACRATRDELERVVARARHLRYRAPTRALWSSIEADLARSAPRRGQRRVVTLSLARLAAAAAIVAMIAGGVTWMVATNRASTDARVASVSDSLRPGA